MFEVIRASCMLRSGELIISDHKKNKIAFCNSDKMSFSLEKIGSRSG